MGEYWDKIREVLRDGSKAKGEISQETQDFFKIKDENNPLSEGNHKLFFDKFFKVGYEGFVCGLLTANDNKSREEIENSLKEAHIATCSEYRNVRFKEIWGVPIWADRLK